MVIAPDEGRVIEADIQYDQNDANITAWRAAVAQRQTTLGYTEWCVQHHMRMTPIGKGVENGYIASNERSQ